MKMRWAWMLPVLSILALVVARSAAAQGYAPGPAAYPGPMPAMAPPGYMPAMAAGYMAPQPGLLPDAYGAYGAVPVGMPPQGPVAMGPQMMTGNSGMDTCPYCGGAGCDACMGRGGHHGLGNGLLGDVCGLISPYPDGGCAAVHWYDFAVDFMYLRREDAGRRVDFTSSGINGPIVLDSTDLDFDNEPSFRFSAMFQIGPGSDVEFTYFGLFFWDNTAVATDSGNNLFSAFSQFGNVPAGGFAETDASDRQSIDYESHFDSFEVSFRQRWMAANCRYQGSCLCGVRYFKLDEDFNYFTQSTLNGSPGVPASMTNNINVHNNMVGFQLGGDMWMCVLPGLRLGGEGKAGVYGNHIALANTISVNTGATPNLEDLVQNDVSLVAQADVMATYRLNYQWTFKAGYQFLFVDGVALAVENFNPVPPASFSPPPGVNRRPQVNDNGNVFYHGWSAGLEFLW